MNDDIMRNMVESKEEWRKWCTEIPHLHFNSDWDVKIIPPFAGALIRFVVSKNNKSVSVYFDGYSRLGYMYDSNDKPIPYFEIYPFSDSNDAKIYYIDETDEMLIDIKEILDGNKDNTGKGDVIAR